MSSSRSNVRFVIALAGASLFAGGSGLAISACSSSTTDAPASGTDSSTPDTSRTQVDATVIDDDSAIPDSGMQTTDQCLTACDKAHPSSVAKYNQVDTCWGNFCQGACVDGTGAFDAGLDSGPDAGGDRVTDGGALCGSMESSGADQSCDDCTTEYCCGDWNGCYKDTDCIALDTCYNACP